MCSTRNKEIHARRANDVACPDRHKHDLSLHGCQRASLARCGGGGVSRVGTERASLAPCGGSGDGGVGVGMEYTSQARCGGRGGGGVSRVGKDHLIVQ